MVLHIPNTALFVVNRNLITVTVWGRTLFHWRSAKARAKD